MGSLSHRVLRRPGVDRVFDTLSKQHRRHILIELNHGNGVHEQDLIYRGSSEDENDLQLRHDHLPKLAEAGYIEWDRETGAIGPGLRFDEIEPLLELIEDHADQLPDDWP